MSIRFGKEHKLKSKLEIDLLFKKGSRIHSPMVTMIFYAQKPEQPVGKGVPRLLVSVPKRNFKKAVDRNLLKRQIREAYRQQLQGCKFLNETSYQLYLALVYKDNRIREFNDIQSSIALLLRKLEGKTTQL